MVKAKTNLFDDSISKKALLFKALSHPARLAILKFLAETKSCITGDISDQIPLGRTTVNQHLKELKDVGLIIGETSGVKTNYCLDPITIKEVADLLGDFFDELGECRCGC